MSHPDRGSRNPLVSERRAASDIVIGLNAVVVAVTGGEPRILTVRRVSHSLGVESQPSNAQGEIFEALPFGPFDPAGHRTLELGLRAWVGEQTSLTLGYVEQLYTFADLGREANRPGIAARVVSVGYLALVREAKPAGAGDAHWQDWYRYFPWEDWRGGQPAIIADSIGPRLIKWARTASDAEECRRRDERVRASFGLIASRWDEERVLERYELLYQAGLVPEALLDRGLAPDHSLTEHGRPMAYDHRRILATAMSRLRGKIKYRPVVFEVMPPSFTLLQLLQTVEALAGMGLHKQNFRRLVEQGGLVEPIGETERGTGGRPAAKFRFRREVLVERPAPGVRLPGSRRSAARNR
jgi:hypothetical protein